MLEFLLHTCASPAEDLALEEALHLAVEENTQPATWRVWQPQIHAVILGTGQESAREADLELARKDHVPVLRRHSGGGAVLIGPGALNFSAFYPLDELPGSDTIRGATSAVLQRVIPVLKNWGLGVQEAGVSDLAVLCSDGTLRKLAGNSQARKKRSVTVHGTMLAAPDWARIEALLRFPSATPDYRAGRAHRDFLTSLHACGAPSSLEEFAAALVKALPGVNIISAVPGAIFERAAVLLRDKYSRDDWNLRR